MTQQPADHSNSPAAHKQRTFRWGGVGALVQLLGVVGMVGAFVAGFLQTRGFFFSTAFAVWAGAGVVFFLVALTIGSELSKSYRCGHCGSPLADKHVAACPACRGQLM
jgi:hypothetical protein